MGKIIEKKIAELRKQSLDTTKSEKEVFAYDFAILQLENVLREFRYQTL